jgi:Flp pilus assembly protein TadG
MTNSQKTGLLIHAASLADATVTTPYTRRTRTAPCAAKGAHKVFAFLQDVLVTSTRFPVISRFTAEKSPSEAPARLRVARTSLLNPRRAECDGHPQPAL